MEIVFARTLTCIVCPRGCALTVELTDTDGTRIVKSVTGNLCPRGKAYAEDECTHPTRTLTTTVRTTAGGVVAVKTDAPIPREFITAAMVAINAMTVSTPVRVGDVLAEHFLADLIENDTVRLVATQNHP